MKHVVHLQSIFKIIIRHLTFTHLQKVTYQRPHSYFPKSQSYFPGNPLTRLSTRDVIFIFLPLLTHVIDREITTPKGFPRYGSDTEGWDLVSDVCSLTSQSSWKILTNSDYFTTFRFFFTNKVSLQLFWIDINYCPFFRSSRGSLWTCTSLKHSVSPLLLYTKDIRWCLCITSCSVTDSTQASPESVSSFIYVLVNDEQMGPYYVLYLVMLTSKYWVFSVRNVFEYSDGRTKI